MSDQAVQYVAVIESCPGGGYSAYVPDLPGVAAAAGTLEGCKQALREVIPFHIESLRTHGDPVPEPSAVMAELVAA